MKAIIPVAGAGTKLRPHTYTQPKALIPLAGKTVLSIIVDQLNEAGVNEFIFIIGYLGEKIQDYVKIYNNHFSQDFCKSVVLSLEKAEWQKHYYYTSAGTSLTYDDDLSMSYESIPEYDDLHKATWHALNQYVKTDLKGFAWFNTWHNFSMTIKYADS